MSKPDSEPDSKPSSKRERIGAETLIETETEMRTSRILLMGITRALNKTKIIL